MGKERSHVHKRRRGCLTGCLTNILLTLGVLALIFVLACVLGFVKNDPVTGAPSLTLENIGIELPKIEGFELPEFENLSLPAWAYRVEPSGLTVKTLRAGGGEAVLVCADGYTMLLGAGDGNGLLLCAQLLLSGIRHVNVAVAMQSSDDQIGGMQTVLSLMKPEYLLYTDSQVKGNAYNAMMSAADKLTQMQRIVPDQGLTFSLGRATVTVVGPAVRHHTEDRDDGLSVRIDYGNTGVLVMGPITQGGERELVNSGARLDADVLIVKGSEETASLTLVEAVAPKVALLTGKCPANPVKVRLQRAGAEVFTKEENGVMTVFSDGTTLTVQP